MFTDELKKARKARGMTQKDAAKALSIDTSTYCGYETGKREPDMNKLRKIAGLFNVPIEQLMFGDKLNRLQYHELRNRVDVALASISSSDMQVMGIDGQAIAAGFRSMRPIRIEQARLLANDLGFNIEDLFTDPAYASPSPFTELSAGYFDMSPPTEDVVSSTEKRLMAYFKALSPDSQAKAMSYMEFLNKSEE